MSYPILQFFAHEGMPDELVEVCLPAAHLARAMATELPVCEETNAGLRKLLEARDCFIRAALLKMASDPEPQNDE